MVNSDRHVSGPEQYLTFLSFFPYPKKGKEAERGSTLISKNICVSVLDSSVNNNIPSIIPHSVLDYSVCVSSTTRNLFQDLSNIKQRSIFMAFLCIFYFLHLYPSSLTSPLSTHHLLTPIKHKMEEKYAHALVELEATREMIYMFWLCTKKMLTSRTLVHYA